MNSTAAVFFVIAIILGVWNTYSQFYVGELAIVSAILGLAYIIED